MAAGCCDLQRSAPDDLATDVSQVRRSVVVSLAEP
jgi:hypothetical protein